MIKNIGNIVALHRHVLVHIFELNPLGFSRPRLMTIRRLMDIRLQRQDLNRRSSTYEFGGSPFD
jgi:hypothetical protein